MEGSQQKARSLGDSTSSLRLAVANSSINTLERTLGFFERQVSVPDYTVALSWKDVVVTARSTPSLRQRMKGMKTGKEKVILQGVSGMARPGELIALMGASGAGKTTLLNVLANQNVSRLDVKGSVSLNGREILGSSRLGTVSAYVQQEDLFIGTLTVKEHLRFQAALRMGSGFSKEEKTARVQQVLIEMGLRKCENTFIGIPGRVKGISGGEKKRLAFASEILTNPPLLFADEPTSGLDSFMAESVVKVLQDMAATNRTIVCTIHQPSSEVFALFNHLILLAEGRLAFHGTTREALRYFASIGYTCPENFNPADFYVHTLAIIPGNEKESKEKVLDITEKFGECKMGKELQKTIKDEADENGFGRKDKISSENQSRKKLPNGFKASVFTQFQFVFWRAWLTNVRDPMAVKVKLGQALIVAFLLGLIYMQMPYDQSRLQNAPGALIFMIIQWSITSIIAVLQTFPMETPVFLRDHNSCLYRTSVYYLSKILADMPFLILQVFIFCVISYFMIGFHSGADRFFTFFGFGCLIASVAISLGYIVSAGAPSVSVAMAIGPLSFLPFLLFGGFFLQSGTAPVYLEWIQYISWFYYGFEALMINEWTGTVLSCNSTITAVNGTTGLCRRYGEDVILSFGFNPDNLARDAGILVALLFAFRVLGYVVLYVRVKRNQS